MRTFLPVIIVGCLVFAAFGEDNYGSPGVTDMPERYEHPAPKSATDLISFEGNEIRFENEPPKVISLSYPELTADFNFNDLVSIHEVQSGTREQAQIADAVVSTPTLIIQVNQTIQQLQQEIRKLQEKLNQAESITYKANADVRQLRTQEK